jgi:hypothetical protein
MPAIEAAAGSAAASHRHRHCPEVNGDGPAEVRATAAAFDAEATTAENWGTYSKAQADNAIAAKNEALQWAEYLAGPVVTSAAAPRILPAPFPHGLYYQPVQGPGGVAGLWSGGGGLCGAARGRVGVSLPGRLRPSPGARETNPATGIRSEPDTAGVDLLQYG